MRKIIKNAIQCKLCGEIIESTDRHHMSPANAVHVPWTAGMTICVDASRIRAAMLIYQKR